MDILDVAFPSRLVIRHDPRGQHVGLGVQAQTARVEPPGSGCGRPSTFASRSTLCGIDTVPPDMRCGEQSGLSTSGPIPAGEPVKGERPDGVGVAGATPECARAQGYQDEGPVDACHDVSRSHPSPAH